MVCIAHRQTILPGIPFPQQQILPTFNKNLTIPAYGFETCNIFHKIACRISGTDLPPLPLGTMGGACAAMVRNSVTATTTLTKRTFCPLLLPGAQRSGFGLPLRRDYIRCVIADVMNAYRLLFPLGGIWGDDGERELPFGVLFGEMCRRMGSNLQR